MSCIPFLTHGVMDSHVLFRCEYGKHLSKEQVAELVAPHLRTLELLNYCNGIPSLSIMTRQQYTDAQSRAHDQSQHSPRCIIPAYRHVESHKTIFRTVGYPLPPALHEHMRTVVPVTAFAHSLKQWHW
ncbi:hypothetical protein EI94DRAFT_1727676 [Lactarius quietus]|nr:hypothetical protein EI94DRAFT_1727676 [Lactarius quietus]